MIALYYTISRATKLGLYHTVNLTAGNGHPYNMPLLPFILFAIVFGQKSRKVNLKISGRS